MEKEFVPYDRALKLNVLGFNEPCFGYYQQEWHDDGMTELEPSLQMIVSKQHQHAFQLCTAPTFSQAFRWFREKGIYSFVWKAPVKGYFFNVNQSGGWDCFDTYEEAELACLDNLIQIFEKTKAKKVK